MAFIVYDECEQKNELISFPSCLFFSSFELKKIALSIVQSTSVNRGHNLEWV